MAIIQKSRLILMLNLILVIIYLYPIIEETELTDDELTTQIQGLVYDIHNSNAAFFEGINEILVSRHDLKFLDNASACINGEILGAYSDKMIMIKDRGPEVNKNTLFHEIGHNIWKKLTKEQREEWNILFHNTENFITPYSKTNSNENFAENFACFYSNINNCTDNMMPEKKLFIEQAVN